MQVELSFEDAKMLRELRRQRIGELDKEIKRTDSLSFKHQLEDLDRRMEPVLGEISNAVEQSTR
jgi:ssRNA-specific RNase YbeY (16S rRNA maturation enzyme)